MFSTATAAVPSTSAAAAANSTAPSRRTRDSDVRMRDAPGTEGGRKSTNKVRPHRMRGTGIELYKSGGVTDRPSLAARVRNVLDPDGTRATSLSIRGASAPGSTSSSSAPGARTRRNAVSVVLRDPGQPTPLHQVEAWKEFVKKRYNAENQFLNLENMEKDEIITRNNLNIPGSPQASYREGAVILKIASTLQPEVKSISLANNKLRNLDHFYTLNHYLPKLANISLQNNQITEFSSLDKIGARKGQVSLLREIILLDNPIRNNEAQRNNLPRYTTEVRRRFPMLEVLDMQPLPKIDFDVSSDVSRAAPTAKTARDYPLSFPLPMGGNSVAEEHQALVGQFLTKFLTGFDTDRASLRCVYAPNATFSYACNTSIPARARIEGWQHSKEMPNQVKLEWSIWLENSRNLQRMGRSIAKSTKTLSSGVDEILAHFALLPQTQHDLTSPEKLSLDARLLDGSLQNGEPALFITLHGQFTEAPSLGVRSFDRSFVVASAPAGSAARLAGWDVVILSDQLIIRNFSSHLAWKPGPMKVVPDSMILEPLPEPQRQLVMQLSSQTKLNYQFAIQCLSENGWDMGMALANFEAVKTQLGPEAYLQS